MDLPEIVDDLRERTQRFVVYCDDIAFEDGETQYKHLKSVLEGSLELPPENVRLYATSNRRHLVSEYQADNEQSRVVGREIHHGDVVEEKISLSDRFGLSLSFYPINEEQYFEIVDHLFAIGCTFSLAAFPWKEAGAPGAPPDSSIISSWVISDIRADRSCVRPGPAWHTNGPFQRFGYTWIASCGTTE